jgi:small subunit ribosomal protein S6e
MVRVVISNPEEGKAYQIEPEESQINNLIGLNIGDEIEGEKIGLAGYVLELTGGTDEDGFPMRGDIRGRGRSRALLSSGSGYKPKEDGERRRKTVRGNTISGNTMQINTKIVEAGGEPIEKALGLEPVEEEVESEEE